MKKKSYGAAGKTPCRSRCQTKWFSYAKLADSEDSASSKLCSWMIILPCRKFPNKHSFLFNSIGVVLFFCSLLVPLLQHINMRVPLICLLLYSAVVLDGW